MCAGRTTEDPGAMNTWNRGSRSVGRTAGPVDTGEGAKGVGPGAKGTAVGAGAGLEAGRVVCIWREGRGSLDS